MSISSTGPTDQAISLDADTTAALITLESNINEPINVDKLVALIPTLDLSTAEDLISLYDSADKGGDGNGALGIQELAILQADLALMQQHDPLADGELSTEDITSMMEELKSQVEAASSLASLVNSLDYLESAIQPAETPIGAEPEIRTESKKEDLNISDPIVIDNLTQLTLAEGATAINAEMLAQEIPGLTLANANALVLIYDSSEYGGNGNGELDAAELETLKQDFGFIHQALSEADDSTPSINLSTLNLYHQTAQQLITAIRPIA